MGFVQDITELMRKGPEIVSRTSDNLINMKSIAKGAKDSTFQFPCLMVDSVPIDMANTIARTLDQVYASFTQTWLSMNSMFDITIDPTPLSYLKKLHQNLKLEGLEVDNEDIDKYMEKVYDGSYRLYMNESHTYGVLFNVADHATMEMVKSHKDLITEHMSEYDLTPITEADVDDNVIRKLNSRITDAEKSIFGDGEGDVPSNMEVNSAYDMARAAVQGQIARGNEERRLNNLRVQDRGKVPKLTERDLKKSNDMLPFGLEVRLIAVNDKKEFVQYIDFVVGVKAILHSVSSQDMIENIARALQNKSLVFKLLRWTTGEISLVKDIILNLGEIKNDAMSKTNGKSPFFNTLKRLKNRRFTMRNFTMPTALIPNATIVITSYEADQLEQKYGINVRDEKIANKLISSLFLMSFIIMDEGTSTISVLYDGDTSYQIYALETLERDNNLNSNKLGKEIGRMISR